MKGWLRRWRLRGTETWWLLPNITPPAANELTRQTVSRKGVVRWWARVR
jgi:hypothetical protein